MKRALMEILACPIDKHHPLDLLVFEEKDEIVEGVIICPGCHRWYPIRDEIPEMLPDELRKDVEDLPFLKKWKEQFPEGIVKNGKPFNLKG
ncbi:MAG: Trm112 family protein [Candidatus Bathyarchaeota archaeon]|nr:Trm112 family protein [Candidatus Termiticorpusculum sp.]MCL1970562.1 Trm112 family protein [Candidatus Termiticorpusculum sp.]